MNKNALAKTLSQAVSLATAEMAASVTDGHLLDRFLGDRDPVAFAALVERHGAMVHRVCSRILNDTHDTEDACQVTFLVLARRASGIRKRMSVASWLHGVARRVSLALLRDQMERRKREGHHTVGEPTGPTSTDLTWDEVKNCLDEELDRLPERLREPLVLCYLEGKTRDEAAAALGHTPGRLHGLLERGRNALRDRLVKRGVTLGASLLTAELAMGTSRAVPPALAIRIVNSAVTLAAGQEVVQALATAQAANVYHEVIRAMIHAKMKTVSLWVLTVGVACTVLGGVAAIVDAGVAAAVPGDRPAEAKPAPPSEPKTASGESSKSFLVPGKPLVLPDGKSRIEISATGSLNGVRGTPKFVGDGVTIDLVQQTVIAANGYLFHLTTPHDYQLKPVLYGDVGSETVQSCKIEITSEKANSPVLTLGELSGKLKFKLAAPIFYDSNAGKRTSPIQRIEGKGAHFIAVRVTGVSYYKVTGKDEKLVDLNLDVITSFGVKQLTLKSGDTATVKVGPESIKLSSLSFDGNAEVVVGVESKPEVKEASAVVVRYDDTAKPAKVNPKSIDREKSEKPELETRILESADKDIVVVSDRDETLTEFFQRQRLVVGDLEPKDRKLLTAQFEAKENSEKLFLSAAAYNHSPGAKRDQSTFGAYIHLAPIPAPVAAALKTKEFQALILLRGTDESNDIADNKNPPVWKVIGYTTRNPSMFFDLRNKKGKFDPEALWYVNTTKGKGAAWYEGGRGGRGEKSVTVIPVPKESEWKHKTFSSDKKLFAIWFRDGWDEVISIHDAASGKQLRAIVGHGDEVVEFKFSEDGRLLGSRSTNSDRVGWAVWEVATGKLLFRLPEGKATEQKGK